MLCNLTFSQESRCCVTSNRWDTILRSPNAKYHNSYLFFDEINKGHIPLMYSCVLWFEISNLVVFLAVIVWPLSLSSQNEVKAAQKNSLRSGPCLFKGGLRPEKTSNRRFFRPEANFCYRYTAVNVWKRRMSLEHFLEPCPEIRIPSVFGHCDTATWHVVGPRSNSPRPRVAQSN